VQKFDGDLQAAVKAYVDEQGIVPAPLRYDHSSSSSRCCSGDAQEEVPHLMGRKQACLLRWKRSRNQLVLGIVPRLHRMKMKMGSLTKNLALQLKMDSIYPVRNGVHAIEELKKRTRAGNGCPPQHG
jgi:hypothetical protein